LRTRQWQDKDGNTRYTTEIQADEMTMLDRASGDGGGGSARPAMPAQQPAPASTAPLGPPPNEADDLPF
jgi:single-strand DNA-binding protein